MKEFVLPVIPAPEARLGRGRKSWSWFWLSVKCKKCGLLLLRDVDGKPLEKGFRIVNMLRTSYLCQVCGEKGPKG